MDHTPAIVMCWKTNEISIIGVFNVQAIKNIRLNIFCNDGSYKDAIYEMEIQVTGGQIDIPENFLFLYIPSTQLKNCRNFKSDLIY